MTLKHLKVFVSVCENGGITKAAAALHMVQPAVSTSVSELEKYYKVKLFDRVNQRLVLTELGKELLIKAKNTLAEFDGFEQTAELGGQNPKVSIGSSLTLGRTVLPKLFALIKSELPSLKPSFVIDRASVIEKRIECGELDFGFIEGDVRSARLKKLPFGEDRLLAVCSPDYPAKNTLMLDELLCHPLLLREQGSASRYLFDKLLAERHLLAKPFVESVSNEALVAFAEVGHGVSVLPEGIVNQAIENKLLRPITVKDASLSRTHYIVMHKNKRLNPLCLSAIELLKTAVCQTKC